jgi:hypothetical protein
MELKMKNIWKWIVFGLIVFLVAFMIALPAFGGWRVMPHAAFGYGMMRGGMMGWGWGGFGGIGMLIGSLLPILAIAGVAALIYSLMKRHAPSEPPALPATPCASCGKPLDPGWMACPYCGKKRR